jgi:Fic family protein
LDSQGDYFSFRQETNISMERAVKDSDFVSGFPGKLVQTTEGAKAFVPNALPPEIPVDLEVMKAHGDARAAVAALNAALPRASIDPYLLARPLMQREAFYSSQMEGTYTTPRNMVLFEAQESDASALAASDESTLEVVNYVRAIEKCLSMIQRDNLPVCHRMIKTAHRMLLRNTRGADKRPGEYRESQNYIGREIDGLARARFVPPPPAEARAGMDELEKYIGEISPEATIPPFISLALVHYQFETIHPFEDGNGRIGRLLIPLILIEKKIINAPLLHLSAALEKRKPEYTDRLLAVSQRGEWRAWILFFLRMIAQSAQDTKALTDKLWDLRQSYITQWCKAKSSGALTKLIDSMFSATYVTFNKAARVMGVTHAAASVHVRRLQKAGILKEVSGRRWGMIFVAPAVMELLYGEGGS